MATRDQLITRVRRVIRDNSSNPSYTSAEITDKLNEGMKEIAAGIKFDQHYPSTPPLPELIDSSAVAFTSGATSATLPTNYQRKVFTAVDTTNDRKLTIDRSYVRFLRRDPAQDNSAASPTAVYIKGRTLMCHPPAQSGQTITVYYHRFPTDMSSGGSTPDGLPEEFHYKALVSYAAKELFDEIEDGVEGKKANTSNQEAKFNRTMLELYDYYGPEDGEPGYIEDREDYIRDDYYWHWAGMT